MKIAELVGECIVSPVDALCRFDIIRGSAEECMDMRGIHDAFLATLGCGLRTHIKTTSG